jgi:V/A-type H+-transporting ATPase subunit I
MVVFLIVGHTFNLALAVLGAYVHSSRLQYVEFFGKFFEGEGKAFDPLRIRTRYIQGE